MSQKEGKNNLGRKVVLDITENICGNCSKIWTDECPKSEYKDRKLNQAIVMRSDGGCDQFKLSVYKKNQADEGFEKLSQANQMVVLALENITELYHDERSIPYICQRNSKYLITRKLRSRDFKTYLAGLLYNTNEKAPNQEALASAINVLEAKCQAGPEHKLYNRVAPGEDGSIWIDMGDKKERVIHVMKKGWEIVDTPPILFRRYTHQSPLPEPVKDGDIDKILEFANLKNESDNLLYQVTAVTCLIPGIPHVVLIMFGPRGGGKSTALLIIRNCVDPSTVDLLGPPHRKMELVQTLDHNWCGFFDNVTEVKDWMADVFCSAVTGTGEIKRALYTDDDDVIYNYRRCVGITCISIVAKRGDFLQRSLLLPFALISKKERKTDKEIQILFKENAPKIFGGMLNVLVKALQIYPTIKLPDGLHRMADYMQWGCAITEAMGKNKEEFLNAYDDNVNRQDLEAVYANPICDALIKFMEGKPKGWEGTASQLHSHLKIEAKELEISTRQKEWPKTPRLVSCALNDLIPALPSVGLKVTRSRGGKKGRIIHIEHTIGWVQDNIPVQPTNQETLELKKAKWQGPYEPAIFDKRIMDAKGCSREDAEHIRMSWMKEGIINETSGGLINWV